MIIAKIAQLAHEANRAYCATIGDDSQLPWDQAPEWAKESAVKGVRAIMEGKVTRPSQSHESWLEEKIATGWSYGPVKDVEKKQHPCFVPYFELPREQQLKDYIFFSVVKAALAV